MTTILLLAGGVMAVILGMTLNYAATLESYFAGWSYAAYVIAVVMGALAVINFIVAIVQLNGGRGVKRQAPKIPKRRRRK